MNYRRLCCAALVLVSALVACLPSGTTAARQLFQTANATATNATATNATAMNATATNSTLNSTALNVTGFSEALQLPGTAVAPVPAPAAAVAPPAGSADDSLDLGSIPEACINGGTELQTYCSESITAAQEYFQVPPDAGVNGNPPLNITEEQVQDYVRTAPPPSPMCCKAACDFNADYCNCNRGILAFAEQLTGNNADIYRSIAESFQSVCGYRLMYGPTCPPPAQRPSMPSQVCPAAVPAEPQVTPAG